MNRYVFIAAFYVAACQSSSAVPPASEQEPAAPSIVLEPPAGAYQTNALELKIIAPSEAHALWVAVGVAPDSSQSAFMGHAQILLKSAGRVHVMVADPEGRIWGPFVYSYRLAGPPPGQAACMVEPERSLLNGAQTVRIHAMYFPASELDRFFLSQDGVEREVSRDELEGNRLPSFAAGPWPEGGTHQFGCRVAGPQPVLNLTEITVDAEPPTAAWVGSSGAQGRADWPAAFSLTAEDDFSGVGEILFCSTRGCVPPQGFHDGAFRYDTAFTAGTQFQTAITAVVRDLAGNVTLLDPIAFGVAFAEPPAVTPVAISTTTEAEIALEGYLALDGRRIVEVRRLDDFTTALSADHVPLKPGWNDFLFLQAGKTDWESFAIYRVGFSAELPPGPELWLVYTSTATAPAMHGELAGTLSGNQFLAGWWEIPHVWFVKDLDGDGAWSFGDMLCAPGVDPVLHPWTEQAAATAWSARPSECMQGETSVSGALFQVSCESCADGGRLYLEPREDWSSYPLYHAGSTAVTAGMLVLGAATAFPQTGAPICLFFWDENADALLDENEPRSFSPCDAENHQLARRGGPLRAEVEAGTVRVHGLPYGGAAWGSLESTSGDETVTLRALGKVVDADGFGAASFRLPDDVPPVVPWFVRVTDAESATTVALPVVYPAPITSLRVKVLNDYNLPFSSAATVLLYANGGYAGAIYDGDGVPFEVGVDAANSEWSGHAMRDGYLSVIKTAPADTTDIALYLFTDLSAGRIEGRVVDATDAPVPYANVSWIAPPYQSQTVADGEGKFSILGLGNGAIWAEEPATSNSASMSFNMISDSLVTDLTLRLPGGNIPGPATGLLGDAAMVWISGAHDADTVSDPPFYHASLTDGIWRQSTGEIERRFLYPGRLPSFTQLPFVPTEMPPSVGPGLEQYLACGDRLQPIGQTTALIDAPCWRWYVDTGLDLYFLGVIESGSTNGQEFRFGTLGITALFDDGNEILLHDRLFNRTLHLALSGSRAEGVVAAGSYAVTSSDGTPLTDPFGNQATVSVFPGGHAEVIVARP